MKHIMKVLPGIILIVSLSVTPAISQQPPDSISHSAPVRVKVTAEQVTNTLVYHYRVFNSGPQPIVAFHIGYDFNTRVQLLPTTPIGWDYGTGLAANTTTSPTGWNVSLVTQEEGEFFKLTWVLQSAVISLPPGQALSGFSARLSAPSSVYQSGRWTVFFQDGTPFVGNIEPDVPGDVNGDDSVDCADVAIVKSAFGSRAGQAGFQTRADLNADGVVDVRDLAIVSQKLPTGTRCQ